MFNSKLSPWLLVFFAFSAPAFAEEQASKTTEVTWHGFALKDLDATRVGLNWVYGDDAAVDGAQLSLLFGASGQNTEGWQGSLLTSLTGQTMTGLQSSLFYNGSNELRGVSLALFGINNAINGVLGTQIGLIGNFSGQDSSYGQLGLVNYTEGYAGIGQVGVFSFNRGFRGVQFDPLASISFGEIVGAQIGSVNYAEKFTGLQFGLINIANEGTGVQFGLINISNALHGVPIGILDIQRNGENHFFYTLETPFDEALAQQYHSIGYRFGSKYFYKSMNFGFRTGRYDSQLPLYSFGLQVGGRLPIVNETVAFMADMGINVANWHQAIKIDSSETFQDHLIPETKEMLEWKFSKRFGMLCGLKQRYYADLWNDEYLPDNAFAFIKAPGGNLYIQNSFFIGVEY